MEDFPPVIGDDELEDFEAAFTDSGHCREDYEFSVTMPDKTQDKGFATARNHRSGTERSYPIGPGSVFPADFRRDLQEGRFT